MSQFLGVPFGRQFAENFADRPVSDWPFTTPPEITGFDTSGFGGGMAMASPCGPSLPPGGGAQMKKIIGVTRDSAGSPLGSVTVQAFLTATDAYVRETVSDAGGYYVLCTQFDGQTHYLVAYKTGSPDVAGTTVNTITPA